MLQPERRIVRQGRWRQVIRRQESSGLSVARFCERERITPTTFYRWKRALSQSDSTAQNERRVIRKVVGRQPEDPQGHWLPVSVVAEACSLLIELPRGVRVEVRNGCERELLRDVLALLGDAGSADRETARC